eukprot:gene14975-17709_t
MMRASSDGALKIKFQESGGLHAILQLARTPKSPHGLVYSALVALCETCHGCEENKAVLDASGYSALSALVKGTSVVVDEHLFQMFVELTMCDAVIIRPSPRNYLANVFSPRVASIASNIMSPQPQYTSILPHSKRQVDPLSCRARAATRRINATIISAPTIQHNDIYGDEINLGDDDVTFKDLPNTSNSSPISSPNEPGSLSTSQHNISANQHHHHHHHHLLQVPSSKTTGIVRVPSFRNLFTGTRRNSIGSWAGSFDDLYGVCFTPDERTSRNHAITSSFDIDDKETIYSYTLLGRSCIRSPDAAFMLVDLLPQSPAHIQQHNLLLLMKILESNPQNKRMLCAAQGLKFLLHLSHQSPEETQSYYSRLIVVLGLYDISPSEVRLLFDLACFPSFASHPQLAAHAAASAPPLSLLAGADTRRKNELQMQVLYVIGTLTERKTPPLYFHFDGFDSSIALASIERFPSARSGYTFAAWIKAEYFLSDEAGLFSWQDGAENNIVEVYLKALPASHGGEAASKRYLCVQTRAYPAPPETFSFDKFAFSECGNWHHIVVTHSRAKISLYVDGKFVQNCSTLNYPRLITKDKPIQGIIGRRTYNAANTSALNTDAPNSSNNSSSNLSQLIAASQLQNSLNQQPSSHSSFNSLSSIDPYFVASTLLTQQITSWHDRGYFCGQMGTIHFFEGIWEAPSCLKVYSRGNLYNNSYKQLGIENKEFLVIKPASSPANAIEPLANPVAAASLSMSGDIYFMPPMSAPSSPQIPRNLSIGQSLADATLSPLAASSDTAFMSPQKSGLAASTPSLDDPVSSLKRSALVPNETQGAVIEFIGGVNVHQTRCLKDVIKEVGGIHLCFPFLDMAPAQQVAGLRILAGLLHKSESNKAQFRDLNGFAVLYHLLLRFSGNNLSRSELSMETFEILFELLLDGINNQSDIKQLWSHDCVADGITKLNQLLSVSLQLEGDASSLLNILKKIVPHISTDDVESLFEYIVYNSDGEYKRLQTKAKIVELVYEEMRKCPPLLEHLRSLGGFNVVFSLMDLPSEEIRVTAVKLIGLLMHSNTKAASLFRRNGGFDLLAVLLGNYPPSLAVCRALLTLMVDGFKFDPKCIQETKQRSSSWISLDFFTRDKSSDSLSTLASSPTSSSQGGDMEDDDFPSAPYGDGRTIVYPEALHTMLLLLYSSDASQDDAATKTVQYQCLFEVEKVLDSINMEILWNQPWFEWLYQFIEHQGFQLTKENRVYSQTLSICKRMIMQDITKKTSKIIKVKEVCIDFEEFYVHIVDSVLDYFEKDFVLPTNEATDIIKNLVIYFKSLEDIAVPPDTSMRILNAINQLAFHNTPSTRTTMKSNGLYDIRDALIIHLLRCDVKGVIFTFDFESVVDQKAFRESNNGLLYLLYFFHISVNDTQLQIDIYSILKNVLGGSEENRKIISNILEDPSVIQMFFDASSDQPIDTPSDSSNGGNDNNNQVIDNAFIEWYYRDDFTPKRIEIETRIGKLMAPVETKHNSSQEKLVKAKEKRIKQRKDKISKHQLILQKLVQETEEKRRARATKMINAYTTKTKAIPRHSEDRLKLGKERWDYFKQKLWDSERTSIFEIEKN